MIGAFCSLCLIVDVAAIVAGAAGVAAAPSGARRRTRAARRAWAWALLGALAVRRALVWPKVRPRRTCRARFRALPARQDQRRRVRRLRVPVLPMLHPTLKKLDRRVRRRVNFVRLNMPLECHPNARDAGARVVCADEQGKGEAMADAVRGRELLEPRGAARSGEEARRSTSNASNTASRARDRASASSARPRSCATRASTACRRRTSAAPSIVGAQPKSTSATRSSAPRAARGEAAYPAGRRLRGSCRSSAVAGGDPSAFGRRARRSGASTGPASARRGRRVLHSPMASEQSGAAGSVPFEVFQSAAEDRPARPPRRLAAPRDHPRARASRTHRAARRRPRRAARRDRLRRELRLARRVPRGFDITLRVMQTEEALERIAYELAEDAARENVRYMEVRYSPMLHTRRGLKLTQRRRGGARGPARARAKRYGIKANVIICGIRNISPESSLEMAELAVAYKNRGVVGFDLAGAEVRPSRRSTTARRSSWCATTTSTAPSTPARPTARSRSRRRSTSAARTASATAAACARTATCCTTSTTTASRSSAARRRNVQTGAVRDLASHPLKLYFDLGLRVTINTDNRLITDTTVSKELWLVHTQMGVPFRDIKSDDRRRLQVELPAVPREAGHAAASRGRARSLRRRRSACATISGDRPASRRARARASAARARAPTPSEPAAQNTMPARGSSVCMLRRARRRPSRARLTPAPAA